jgi:hypothetical protein
VKDWHWARKSLDLGASKQEKIETKKACLDELFSSAGRARNMSLRRTRMVFFEELVHWLYS